MRALRLARVERDGEQQEAREVGGALAVVQDPVVPGVVEAEIREVPQRRMGVADAVQEPDVRLDVAGTVPVPGADLVLLRVEVFLLARDRLGLAEQIGSAACRERGGQYGSISVGAVSLKKK